MGRNLVISDIHGCYKTFDELINKINLQKDDNLYLLGDYIDKGIDSSKVLDKIISLSEDFNVFPLMGNHENDIIKAQEEYDTDSFYLFVKLLTKSPELLDKNKKIIKKYYDFMINLPYYYEVGNFILVHGGIDFSKENIFENKSALLVLRYFDKNVPADFNRVIVHGHNPTEIDKIKQKINSKSKVISLDNGCVYNKPHKAYSYMELGNLCCFNLDTYELILQKNID